MRASRGGRGEVEWDASRRMERDLPSSTELACHRYPLPLVLRVYLSSMGGRVAFKGHVIDFGELVGSQYRRGVWDGGLHGDSGD